MNFELLSIYRSLVYQWPIRLRRSISSYAEVSTATGSQNINRPARHPRGMHSLHTRYALRSLCKQSRENCNTGSTHLTERINEAIAMRGASVFEITSLDQLDQPGPDLC